MTSRGNRKDTKPRKPLRQLDPFGTWDLATIELLASDDPGGEEAQAFVPRLRALLDRFNAATTGADTAPASQLPASAAISAEQREQQEKIRALFDRMAEKSRAMQVLGVPERPARADDQFLFQQLEDLFRYLGNRAHAVLGDANAREEARATFERQVTAALDLMRLPLDTTDPDRAKAIRLIDHVHQVARRVRDIQDVERAGHLVANVRAAFMHTYGAAPSEETFRRLISLRREADEAEETRPRRRAPDFWTPMRDAIQEAGFGRRSPESTKDMWFKAERLQAGDTPTP